MSSKVKSFLYMNVARVFPLFFLSAARSEDFPGISRPINLHVSYKKIKFILQLYKNINDEIYLSDIDAISDDR